MSEAQVMSNLESIGDLVGAYIGMAENIKEERYIASLIRAAHNKAATAFDVAAASYASTGAIQHVYEFGVAGITRGAEKYHDPTSPAARLYEHTLTGEGGNQDIGYTFRPATNRNPTPTTASTGVASKYLRKMSRRKYVFYNKAYVMETGETVEIRANRSQWLFIPFGNRPARNPENDRGFVMWNTSTKGPITVQPGADTKGSFSAFWMKWWSGDGQALMESNMTASVNEDIALAVAEAEKKAATETVKPAAETNIAGAAATTRAEMKRIFEAARRRGEVSVH